MPTCIFKDCYNSLVPFSKLTFFNLPTDSGRREQWLARSGNEQVQNLPAGARRVVCEMHFEECYIRRQFHRTTLSRDAIPEDYRRKTKQIEFIDLMEPETYHEEHLQGSPERLVEIAESSDQLSKSNAIEDECSANYDSDDPNTEVIESSTTELTQNEVLSIIRVELNKKRKPVEHDRSNDASNTTPARKIPKFRTGGEKPNKCIDQPTSAHQSKESKIKNAIDSENVQCERIDQSESKDHNQQAVQCTSIVGSTSSMMTEEEYFAMSLVGPLQRLDPQKRAIAKVKILSYLVQLECGIDAQL